MLAFAFLVFNGVAYAYFHFFNMSETARRIRMLLQIRHAGAAGLRVQDLERAYSPRDMIEARLAGGGYVNYETSAFAQPGRECRHNLNYWRFGDYLGIGAGAHSKLSFPDRILRQMRYKQPRDYLQKTAAGAPVQEEHALLPKDRGFEFMMNALRLTEGFPVALFAERTGLPITAAEKPLAQAEARGLIERDHERIRPTELGRRFLNDLLQMFLAGDK